MAIGELVLGAFLSVLFDKLAYPELMRLARSARVDSELDKWRSTLALIQSVLVDAGKKHLENTPIQLWLNELHHLAYDIDNVLDDLATEAMRHQLNQQSVASTSKVLKYIPNQFHALKYGRKMISKLDEITSKLDSLVKEITILGLISNVEKSHTASRPRSEETSLVDVSGFVGREGDKEALLEKLLGNESFNLGREGNEVVQNYSVVSIVGLGGIGKTTVAQILYNEKEVKDHFELTSWICVSDEFNVEKISYAIYKDVSGEDTEFKTLNQLQVALSEKLSKKKFLIVLDDVWNEDYKKWELLQRPFGEGASGSKVIVTTRKTMVASVMDSIQAYPMEVLSNDEALSLFAQHALGKQNFDSHPTLKSHGESIVKKCGGLPLSLTTLGRVLRRKTKEEEWEELLNSEIWNLQNEEKILPALRLSYYDLPPHLKQMFAYCCLFPKDYLFEKNELVLLWMAEGFLVKSEGRSMESLGRDCFEELVSRSFFQHSSIDKSQYTMHDLISDLAMSVAGEFFFMQDDKIDLHDKNMSSEKFHHFSFIRQDYGPYRMFKVLERSRRMRTFLAMSVRRPYDSQKFFLSNKVLKELIPKLQFLRVLNLANYSITEVPHSISNLKHMRYLNFCNTPITCLPEQIGDLYNLQSLLLSGCLNLSRLPDSCVKLINLRHLDISDTPELNETPVGIGGLTSLQTLSKVIIGGASGFKISVLKNLLHLEGEITIKGLHKVINKIHAKEANLIQKKGLCDLELDWSHDITDGTHNAIMEYEVFEALRPSEYMNSLKILYYMGIELPSWVGDPSFVCLTELTLRGCRSCTCLPTLGRLPSLKKMFVESLNGLKRLGPELLGHADSCNDIAFPSLEVLEFKDMEGWEEWSTSGADKDGILGLFPRLREISIEKCFKLDVVVIDLIPSLEVLHVEGCSVKVLQRMVGLSSSIVTLTMEDIKGLTHLDGEIVKHLQKVEYLSISRCDEITNLWESELDILVSLKTLKVRGCVKLVSLAESKKMNLVISSMSCIREVKIQDCPKLEGYSCPNSIEKLKIENCDSMTSLTFPPLDNLPSTLKVFKLEHCHNLEVNWAFSNLFSSLGTLQLFNVSNLRLFPEGCLVHLTHLSISNCENIESIPEKGFGFLPLLCLRYLFIGYCKNIVSFPHEHLQSLTSLDQMGIYSCPSMVFSSGGLWPPNLSFLVMGGLKNGMCEWGMQHFPTSLVYLVLFGDNKPGVVRFAEKTEDGEGEFLRRNPLSSFLLPSSLTHLHISGFEELESVSKGMEHLTSLEQLKIHDCPKLKDLPETQLPSLSLLQLRNPSRELSKKCRRRRRKGKYWPTISQIPDFRIEQDE
ncbi:putative disease resistance RPP13-like protein 1 [Rutidosis leptorrhynchoides]|uniref:putative disease resistance RPP13-like protein 1 n=1 Tax=Rutidosis leptorrhynchoides TaxID=125765 RepID=UPI003A98F0F7